jgi:hypothetical protein
MSKPTLATVKSFIRKNRANLLISEKSRFDGMVDGVRATEDQSFSPIRTPDYGVHDNNMGIAGAWFVFGSRDWITPYEKNGLRGFEVYNCCGNFVLAIKE